MIKKIALVLCAFGIIQSHVAKSMEIGKRNITIHDGTFTQSMASQWFVQTVQRATPLKATDEKAVKAFLQSLLDQGAEINAKDDRGATALMYAACTHNKSLYRWLVHRGADGKICNLVGKKACDFAPASWGLHEASFEDEVSADHEDELCSTKYEGDPCPIL